MSHLSKLRRKIAIFALAAGGLLAWAPGTGEARVIAECPGTTNRCQPVAGGPTYFSDTVCPTNPSDPAKCQARNTDPCPGRCRLQPWIFCVNDNPCSGGDVCLGAEQKLSRCLAGSARAGDVCAVNGDCNDPRGGNCSVDPGTGPVGCCQVTGSIYFPAAETYAGDGFRTTYGSNSSTLAETITGTAEADVICANNGNDTVYGGLGSDKLYGGKGADLIYGKLDGIGSCGTDGENLIDGGEDDDTLVGAGGHDTILGGGGDDVLLGQTGRDALRGGDGDDTLAGNFGCQAVDSVLGSLYCGARGDDSIVANGSGHQCLDAGPDQILDPGETSDCTYSNLPDDNGPCDVGTAVNCKAVAGPILPDKVSCGCE